MASNPSFDISTGADLQGVDNAVNQAVKEVAQRYDSNGSHCTIEFDRAKAEIRLHADDEFRMEQLLDIVQTKMVKRGVPVKNLKSGDLIPATGTSVRRVIGLTQGIETEVANGERGLDGAYPPDSVFGRAALRLEEMAQAVAEWGEGEAKPSGHIITEP